MEKEQSHYYPNRREIAYHEAGHAVSGFLFYPPVKWVKIETELVNGKAYRGRTLATFPHPPLGDPADRSVFKEYLKIIIHGLSGKICQSTVNGIQDEMGAKDDYDFLSIYIFGTDFICFSNIWNELTQDFCSNAEFMKLVNNVAERLLEKEVLCGEEFAALVKENNVNSDNLLEGLAEKYHQRYLRCKDVFKI